jgi:creatinine amidohydrolase
MLASCASLVRDDVRKTLKSTDLGQEDLAVWRKGFEFARKTTPLGYFGDPAAASADEGRRTLQSAAATAADAIVARIRKAA